MPASRKSTTASATRKTSARRSIHPAPLRVTYRWDRHLPVSLRTHGIGTRHTEETGRPVSIFHKHHVPSLHVLHLRSESPAPSPLAAGRVSPAYSVPAPAKDFDTFAKEFFQGLGEEGEEGIEEVQVVEVVHTEAEPQLQENDLTPARHSRVRLWRGTGTPPIHWPSIHLPKIQLPAPGLWSLAPLHRLLPTPYSLLPLRSIAVFVLLSFVFVLPLQAMNNAPSREDFKNRLAADGTVALEHFDAATAMAEDVEFASAAKEFASAGSALSRAQRTLSELGIGTQLLANLIPSQGATLKTGRALVDLGYELSLSAERVSEGFSAIENLTDTSLGTKVAVLERYLSSALPHLASATEALRRMDERVIPEEHQERFEKLSVSLPALTDGLQNLESFSRALTSILGNESKKRYLFVFQNDTEIRPAGGFVGSFAEVDVSRGEIVGLNVPADGSYRLQGSLTTQVAAPRPLQLVNPKWEFQDANWFPDFSASAKKLLAFHSAAGGPTMDGVVAVNARWVADLLQVLGPIEMPAYGRTITADNFLIETQKLVELEYDREANTPKQFLSDLTPKILERIESAEGKDFFPLLGTLQNGLAHKDIQLFFTESEVQKTVSGLGWTGELSHPEGDYLLIANANIGGEKTDAVVNETVDVRSDIGEDGSIQNTVTITRDHRGIPGSNFTGANNVNYVQLFVPRGSRLLEVSGAKPPMTEQFASADFALDEDPDLAFQSATSATGAENTDISEAFGKTVFGNWTQTKPGTSSAITFTYTLPFRLDLNHTDAGIFERAGDFLGFGKPLAHTLTIEPQSGMRERTVHATLSLPAGQTVRWSSDLLENGVVSRTVSGTEKGFLGVLFE